MGIGQPSLNERQLRGSFYLLAKAFPPRVVYASTSIKAKAPQTQAAPLPFISSPFQSAPQGCADIHIGTFFFQKRYRRKDGELPNGGDAARAKPSVRRSSGISLSERAWSSFYSHLCMKGANSSARESTSKQAQV